MFRAPQCRVIIAGQDVTARFSPLLKEINISDHDGLETDNCRMSLADEGGRIKLPASGDTVEAWLGTQQEGVGLVFQGFVDEVRSRGAKSGGRELVLTAKGMDNNGKAKEPATRTADNKSFGEIAQEWAQKHGIPKLAIDPDLAKITRSIWSMQGESFINWGQRIARELGATFKIQGGQGVIVKTGSGKTAGGKSVPQIRAEWGVNLIDWDIAPIVSRTRVAGTASRYYDAKEGKWKVVDIALSNEKRAKAKLTNRFPQANEENAKARAEADKVRSERNSGEGSVTILGTADAKPEGECVVVGARPGIDGTYRIEGVTHRYSKRGYICSLSLKQPQGDAGVDDRKPTAGTQAGSSSSGSFSSGGSSSGGFSAGGSQSGGFSAGGRS